MFAHVYSSFHYKRREEREDISKDKIMQMNERNGDICGCWMGRVVGVQQMAMLKYQQLQKVGSGNFSSVHLVRNIETGQTAAMKLMKTHQNIALKQAYFLKNFDHPNIVRLLDFEQDAARGETRIVLEYLPENTLELYEGQQFGLREEQVKCVLFQAALGLAYVHERGIIHRDIKPQNILIDKRKAEIKLIDFGLAVSLQKVATDYVATRWYRAPENLLGTKEYSCLIDVFSLACVVVQLYLGNPLFPGADNLDQLYRIFNILGEPTDTSWPAGARKYRQLGFKGEGRQKKTQDFGLRSLLKACSEGLVSLLERMLVLNPKKRISARQIVTDGYFSDVKTIIPPVIYKRFEKDHLLKKTTSKEAIENAQSFINQTRSKLKLQDKEEVSQQPSLIMPAQQQTSTNNSILINMALSPRKASIQEEQFRQRQQQTRKAMGMHVLSPKQQNINALRPPHQPLPAHPHHNSAQQQPSILAFRGFNPIKSNKISVKQTRKQQDSYSQHKMSRDNSIESAKSKPKDKLISNSIDLGKKILNSSARVEQLLTKPERRTTNERQYRTPYHKDKSVERASGKVLYYFQGEQKGHSPLRVVMPARPQMPIQGSQRMEQKEGSFLISDSTRITRNNSAINLPSVRLPAQENRSILMPSARQRISHSPGINLTQGRAQPLYTTHNRPFEKLKLITNVASPQLVRQRNDRSQDHSTINVSGMEIAQGSILRGQRTLEFKQKVLVQGNRQLIPANHPHHRPQLIEPQTHKPLPTPSLTKLKQNRSVEPPDTKYVSEREPISLGQFKTLQIDDRRDYREPRISTKKDMSKLTHLLSSPRENNISINLNVSIIDDKPEHSMHSKRPRI